MNPTTLRDPAVREAFGNLNATLIRMAKILEPFSLHPEVEARMMQREILNRQKEA
jgi:hypothetical protein